MALSLKVSNSLERLAESFSADLLRSPGDVFKPDFIITQTQGMNNWLKVQMAYRNGIAANMRFVKPNDILYQVYFRLEGPREQVLAADNLQWVLFTALEDPRFKQRYPRIAGYYKGGDEIKRLGLAQKIADLFDQYQIYRPEMISEWNENSTRDSSLDWQAFLWIDVREKLGAEMPDKTALAAYITTALDDPARVQLLKERLPRVSLFGISILTAFHIDLFYRLSSHIDIRFYLLNPSPHLYWYQDRSPRQLARWNSMPRHTDFASPEIGNTLLTNWGRVIQDTFGLLFHHEEFLNRYDDEEVIPPVPDTLLKKIQFDIFQNAVGEDRQQISATDLMDGSISFNACYTPAREVEVLYNYLVRLVETGKLTTPRDVVVMVNDINTYAPYIRAVFGAAPYHFPYIIADEYLTASQGFFSALQAIMNLEEEDFKAENVLQLLEFNLIRERFQLTRTDLIHQAVREANIRFGIQGSAEDESVTLSWENGLKRIMYGICMTGTGEYTDDGYGFYPLEIAEGEQALDLVRFTHFAEVLIEVTGSRKNPRSLLEWSKYLEDSVERLLISSPDQEDADYMLFQEYLERLKVLSETMKEQISFKVFRQSFVNQMASETRPGNFIGGGITFCSLIPMRSIPFETVAILGLDFDKFPRKEKPVTFDLIRSHPRPGDRNVRENDKHLFLETLLSAGERLYISYIGKNVRDNSSLPPSALVDELLDYITENPTDLIQVHPLHGFSTKYAGDDKRLYTYLGGGGPATEIAGVNQEPQPADFSEIDMGAFINFFKNPIKAYYNKVLDIYYQEDPLLVGDTEVFELNALERWSLKQDLLFLPDDALGDYRDRAVKLGQLPLRHMGDLAIDRTSEEIEDVRKLVRDCIGEDQGTSAYVGIELNGGSMVTGNLAPVYGNKLVRVSFSKNECK
ncbi:MAG TPA: exodeoxyribonuclease V subunit gamma, partial [Chitinophagaceae bacterium]|nr:exodeoxyribonuclease V subunit gamma [Chitinophagaceae bacterium]